MTAREVTAIQRASECDFATLTSPIEGDLCTNTNLFSVLICPEKHTNPLHLHVRRIPFTTRRANILVDTSRYLEVLTCP